MEAGDEHLGIRHVQCCEDVRTGARVGRRGQGDAGHTGKMLAQARQRPVLGTELMPPLADAVRLVDGDQRQPAMTQPVHQPAGQQPLGRDVQQV